LIADEVHRAWENRKDVRHRAFDVVPDITAVAKGIASGLPWGYHCVFRLMTWAPGSHASTLEDPISCVAALETIRLLEEELMKMLRIWEDSLPVCEPFRQALHD
jgi:4-aminobutyrate aminotransferase